MSYNPNLIQRITNLSFSSIWRDLKDAIKGVEIDFTSVKLSKAIFLLAVPMVLEMLMESMFAVVDIFFVSKLGADAVAVVGITESLMTIVYAIGFGLAAGTTAVIARRMGEKNERGASIAAVQSILASLLISLLIALPGAIFAKDLLRLMGADPEIVESYYLYTAILLGGNGIVMLLFVINAAFRSAGDAAIAMRVLW